MAESEARVQDHDEGMIFEGHDQSDCAICVSREATLDKRGPLWSRLFKWLRVFQA